MSQSRVQNHTRNEFVQPAPAGGIQHLPGARYSQSSGGAKPPSLLRALIPSSPHPSWNFVCVSTSRPGVPVEPGKPEGSAAQPGMQQVWLRFRAAAAAGLKALLVAGRRSGDVEELQDLLPTNPKFQHLLFLLCSSMEMSEGIVHLSFAVMKVKFLFLSKQAHGKLFQTMGYHNSGENQLFKSLLAF